jgi:hypothetical protein
VQRGGAEVSVARRCATLVAATFVIACASNDEEVALERNEIGDAITAAESLTAHFADSVNGRLAKDTTAKNTAVGVLVADACSRTDSLSIDRWRTHDLGALPVTLRLPAEYEAVARRRGDQPDSMSQTFRTAAGDEIIAMRHSNALDLVDVPELGKETMCLVDVEKMRVHVETGRELPAQETKTLSASYHLPTGGWFVLHGRAHDVAAQLAQLRILREVRFKHFWSRPLS